MKRHETRGKTIRGLRKESGLSQEELARRIGTTKQTVYKYEKGIVTNIPPDKVEAMSEIFGVTPAVIMGWETNDIGRKIRERRLQLGMTQAELGQKLGIGRSTVCKYEKGVLNNLKMDTQQRIADALKMDVTELFATDYRFFTVSGDDFADLVSGGMDPDEAMAEYDRRVQYYGKKMMQLDYKQRDMIEGMIDELLKRRD